MLLFGLSITGCTNSTTQFSENAVDIKTGWNSVIYGEDSVENVTSSNSLKSVSELSVALVKKADLHPNPRQDSWQLTDESVKERYGTCSDFKLSHEIAPAFCSGVLVTPNVVLTAGHCFDENTTCENSAFVLGFETALMGTSQNRLKKGNIFSCKRIIRLKNFDDKQLDYALIELDRSTLMHPIPLASNTATELTVQSEIYTIGYPLGVAKKRATGVIRTNEVEGMNIVAELDVYGGNSGSPVYDKKTNRLIGILAGGESDFEMDVKNQCEKAKLCNQGECVGELVVPIDRILKDLESISDSSLDFGRD